MTKLYYVTNAHDATIISVFKKNKNNISKTKIDLEINFAINISFQEIKKLVEKEGLIYKKRNKKGGSK